MKTLIFDIKRYAVHDGPGIRTTFFLKGCPLHCKWCQNPESISPAQEVILTRAKCIGCGACAKACGKLDSQLMLPREDCTLCGVCVDACKTQARHFAGKPMTPGEIIDLAVSDKIFYDTSGGGVTFSGGECLSHPSFMEETLRLCKKAGLHTTIDTCGAVPWETFARILPFADLFLYDLKLMDSARHKAYTGLGNEQILSNVQMLTEAGAKVIIRVPLIPGYTDAPKDIAATGDFIVHKLKNRIQRIELLQYNKLAASKYGNTTVYTDGGVGEYPLPALEPQPREYINALGEILTKQGISVYSEVI
ncbi:MAG: glycyl-radical enzyme activating protein [Lachnospiraceae bacterium]|nr:glycyl-radical enzyme activating protein [Lachnospiraceae bacterium]